MLRKKKIFYIAARPFVLPETVPAGPFEGRPLTNENVRMG